MTGRRFILPAIVLSKASVDGDGGARWVADLARTVDELERSWSMTVGTSVGGGTSSFTARADVRDGPPAVLKVAVPGPDFGREVRTLLAADGEGYVRVLAHDVGRHAVLLEGLGQPVGRAGPTPESQLGTIADTLRLAWRVPRSPEAAFDKAADLRGFVLRLWEDGGRPCPEQVVAQALGCARRRSDAFDPERCVTVHGDAAAANLLRVLTPRPGAETGFVFVDPDGFVGDPAYDLGVALRDWTTELGSGDAPSLMRGYCRLLAARTGVDEVAIWDWAFLERVSTGLYALSFGADELARPLLETAEALVPSAPPTT